MNWRITNRHDITFVDAERTDKPTWTYHGEMNKDLPKQLDEITLLKKIELHENREVRYCYTILEDLEFTEEQIEDHRKTMVKQVKQTSTLNKFKEYNVTMAYAYYKQNGDCIMLVKVYPEDYK